MKGAAYLTTFGFFFPGRFPASFEYKGTRTEGAVTYDIVEATPAGLPEADIWIDHHTHLIFPNRVLQRTFSRRLDRLPKGFWCYGAVHGTQWGCDGEVRGGEV